MRIVNRPKLRPLVTALTSVVVVGIAGCGSEPKTASITSLEDLQASGTCGAELRAQGAVNATIERKLHGSYNPLMAMGLPEDTSVELEAAAELADSANVPCVRPELTTDNLAKSIANGSFLISPVTDFEVEEMIIDGDCSSKIMEGKADFMGNSVISHGANITGTTFAEILGLSIDQKIPCEPQSVFSELSVAGN